ncbi:hypothetical protein FQN54_007044 [Arachnomyces sp. PD_36]|nr:hypothetical protein FQN54_007044 [Arachnomyces sp. PD_36]
MANYPPTPSFGGPFNFAPQWPPPPGPHPPYQGEQLPGPPPPLHGPSNHPFMQGKPPTPHIPGLGGTNRVPLPPPPPPFPPPYYNPNFAHSPYFPMPPPLQEKISPPERQGSQASGYNGEPVKALSGEQQTRKQLQGASTPASSDLAHSMPMGNREEGELSDGELDVNMTALVNTRSTHNQRESDMGTQFSDTRHIPSQGPSEINRDDPNRQTGRHTDSVYSRKDLPMNLTSVDSSTNRSPPRSNGVSDDDLAQKSKPTPTMEDLPHTQNHAGMSAFSGTRLPGLGTPPTSRNDPFPVVRNEDSQTLPFNVKSPTQLRVMAQGALLGLAPHNVRFNELVDEGIDPTILRRLYEDIGIKINSDLEEGKSSAQAISSATSTGSAEEDNYTPPEPMKDIEIQHIPSSNSTPRSEAAHPPTLSALGPGASQGKPQDQEPQKSNEVVTEPPTTAASGKPLERKEVIARMLAARAKKPASNQTGPAKESSNAQPDYQPKVDDKRNGVASPTTTPDTQSQSARSTEALVKEKNKAQTELARQRMEQLKKQGFIKSNRRSNPDSASASPPPQPQKFNNNIPDHAMPDSSQGHQESMHYPLPDRPPATGSEHQSRIPGLFMTNSDQLMSDVKESPKVISLPQASPVSRPVSKPQMLPRKRPVASDFTDEPFSSAKRPFQQEERVVIDISEDESMYDGDERMDIDQDPGSKAQSLRHKPQEILSQTRDQPSADMVSKTPAKTPPRPSSQVAPISRTPGKGNDQEHLRQKQLEIDAMRKRIAEFEKRHKAKQTASRTQSPGSQLHPVSSLPETPPIVQEKPLTGNKETKPAPGEPLTAGSELPRTDVQPVLNTSIAEAAKPRSSTSSPALTRASQDPASLDGMRQKFLRKKEIESGLPLLEAELLKYEQRLAEFRKEEQKILAEITKGREGKRQLIAELENLGIETEGLSTEELQATKDSLTETGNLVSTDASAPVQTSHELTSDNDPSSIPKDTTVQGADTREALPDFDPASQLSDNKLAHQPAFETAPSSPQGALNGNLHASIETGKPSPSTRDADDQGISSSSSMDESMSSARSPSINAPIETSPPAHNAVSVPVVPEGSDLPDVGSNPYTSRSDHSQSMSGISEQTIDTPDIMQGQIPDPQREGSVDSDAYEPPEPEQTAENLETISSPPFSPASPHSPKAASATMPSIPVTQHDEALTESFQEPVEELQVARDAAEGKMQPVSNRHFTPYVSPLKQFNAYRYHPSYVDDIHEGYRSLTYSHDIDPDKFICPFEASSGICKDDSCAYQHFRDMYLSDDKILVQMGSRREGKTPQEKEEYIAGLKKIISDMRREKVKDFNTVATEIAAYRRRFLEDPSRVLPL